MGLIVFDSLNLNYQTWLARVPFHTSTVTETGNLNIGPFQTTVPLYFNAPLDSAAAEVGESVTKRRLEKGQYYNIWNLLRVS